MTTFSRLFAAIARTTRAAVSPFLPEPGTTEGALYVGLAMIAGGCAIAELLPLALVVPGAVLVIHSSLPAFAAYLRGGR
jgi:hypothetical protein